MTAHAVAVGSPVPMSQGDNASLELHPSSDLEAAIQEIAPVTAAVIWAHGCSTRYKARLPVD